MEITDFMGLLLPKSFTTDRLAKIYFCFYFIIFLWQNKDHSCPKQLFSIEYYVLTDVTNYAFPVLIRRYSGFMQNGYIIFFVPVSANGSEIFLFPQTL